MKNAFPFAAALLLMFAAAACSKDGAATDPEGTVSLNMLNADNGAILLGDMDVRIDNSDNFSCKNCKIAEIGPVGGLSAIDRHILANLARRAAVKAGCGYAVYRDCDILEFPSGAKAVLADAIYYRMRVESRLADTETQEPIGAHVKYLAARTERHSLPLPGEGVHDMSFSYQYWVTGLPLDKVDEMFIDPPFVIEPTDAPEGRAVLVSRPTWGADADISGDYRLYMRQNDIWSYVTIVIDGGY